MNFCFGNYWNHSKQTLGMLSLLAGSGYKRQWFVVGCIRWRPQWGIKQYSSTSLSGHVSIKAMSIPGKCMSANLCWLFITFVHIKAYAAIYSGSRLCVPPSQSCWLPGLRQTAKTVLQFSCLQNKHKTKTELIDCNVLRRVPDAYFKGKAHSLLM